MFRTGKIFDFLALLLTAIFVYAWIYLSKRGSHVEIRPLAAIDAIDEMIGSAAEKGKKVLFVPRGSLGSGLHAPQVIAGLSLLPRVAQRSAEYGVPIQVAYSEPTIGPLIMDGLETGFIMAGSPDHMKDDTIMFYPDMTHTMGILGLINERGNEAGAVVHVGSYYHETIIWGEAGMTVGAMQIGGTANIGQLAFMITCFDFTLLGEELFAAGAYMSKDPIQIGSIRGQDWSKMVSLIVTILATLCATFGLDAFQNLIGM